MYSKDWINNGVFGIGGETAYRQTARYKSSEKTQKTAEKNMVLKMCQLLVTVKVGY